MVSTVPLASVTSYIDQHPQQALIVLFVLHSRHVRLEHWTSAAGQAAVVARAILGGEPPARPTPYFWSDEFGLRLQHIGSVEGWERIVLDGDEASLAARYLAQDGRLVAALLVNRPQQVGALRRELAPELLAA